MNKPRTDAPQHHAPTNDPTSFLPVSEVARMLSVPELDQWSPGPTKSLDEAILAARLRQRRGPSADSRKAIARAIRAWRRASWPDQARRFDAPAMMPIHYQLEGNFEKAAKAASVLETWGYRFSNLAALAAAQYSKSTLQLSLGNPQQALSHAQRAKGLCRTDLGNRRGAALAGSLEGSAWRMSGDLATAITVLTQTAQEARECEELVIHAAAAQNLGNCYFDQGRLQDAMRQYETALAVARSLGDRTRTHNALLGITATRNRMGFADTGDLDRFEAGLENPVPRNECLSAEYRAVANSLTGNRAEADTWFLNALRLAEQHGLELLVGEVHRQASEHCLRFGDAEGAAHHLSSAEASHHLEAEDKLALARIRFHLDWLGGSDRTELMHSLKSHFQVAADLGFGFEQIETAALARLIAEEDPDPETRGRWRVLLEETCSRAGVEHSRIHGSPVSSVSDPADRRDWLAGFGFVSRSRMIGDQAGWLERIAPTDIPVLIRGESGTGKELIAHLVHRLSDRAEGPFEAINCAAIPGELMESQLFGHRRGSFTGASDDKPGLFTLANGGTLFLDEIGEMSPALQAKLLRVLESGEIRPVGSPKREFVDVRIVAATNVDMRKAIADGGFRKDLYYRLAGMEFHLPPLRERREDILPLAHEFIRQINDTETAPRLSREAATWLLGRPWEGNVRELKLTIRRAMAVCRGGEILPEHLGGDSSFRPAQGLLQEMEAIERVRIRSALEASDFSMTQAAKILGVSRTTLYGKIERLGIELPRKQ